MSETAELPVSVIVPLSRRREGFFDRFGLPSIEINRPAELLIEKGDGSAAKKRNAGAARASQPFLFFCDDDVILARDCLAKLHARLADDEQAGFAVCDFRGIVLHPMGHPLGGNFVQRGVDPDPTDRRARDPFSGLANSSAMALIRSEAFPGFDEDLQALEDRDLWVRLMRDGVGGAYVPEVLFFAFYLDRGLAVSPAVELAAQQLEAKHRT